MKSNSVENMMRFMNMKKKKNTKAKKNGKKGVEINDNKNK